MQFDFLRGGGGSKRIERGVREAAICLNVADNKKQEKNIKNRCAAHHDVDDDGDAVDAVVPDLLMIMMM